MSTTLTTTTSMGFRFLDLPPEVRNEIYILLLTARYKPGQRESYAWRGQPGLTSAIVRVSRRLHAESSALLYSLNVFQAHSALLASMPFFSEISRPIVSPRHSALIRRFYLEVRLDCDPFWSADDLQRAFSGIAELHVASWQASFGTAGLDNLFPFVAVRGVGRATVEGSNVPADFARWLERAMERAKDDDDGGSCSAGAVSGLPWLPEWHAWEQGNR